MANFTMEIREMMNDPLIRGVFTFPYDFYGNEQEKAEFEKLFVQYYYLSEIGFETPERFKLKLQAKLNIIMPYYRQLAMTEWDKVRTVEEMMTSKNLKETTEHKQSIEGSNESESNATSSNSQSDSMNQTSTTSGTTETTSSGTSETTSSETSKTTSSGTSKTASTGTNTSSSSTNEKQSNLADGVAQASLTAGYLTAVGESSNNSSGEATNNSNNETNTTSSGESSNTTNGESSDTTNTNISSNGESNVTTSSKGTAEQNGKTSGSNKQELMESTTFTSIGDIGIQTPAYAITEWRKVLININQLIIDECRDLFMKIY